MRVFVFLHSCYADWEIGYLLPEIIENHHSVVTFGLDTAPVKSLGNLTVTPDRNLSDVKLDEIDVLILPGGDFWEKCHSSELHGLVVACYKRQIPIGAICGATTYLARLGLLNDISHTSNNVGYLEKIDNYKGQKFYIKKPAVCERNIITAGGFGSVEFTYEILKKLKIYSDEDCEVWYRAFKYCEDPSK